MGGRATGRTDRGATTGRATTSGGTKLVVAHDLANLDGRVGGPREPGVRYTPSGTWPIYTGIGSTGPVVYAARLRVGVAIGTQVRATRYPGG
jgi:hypothetical protein